MPYGCLILTDIRNLSYREDSATNWKVVLDGPAARDGSYKNGNFVVTIESIVPNLGVLREYTPLITEFWRDGLFRALDERYFRLVDRSSDMVDEGDGSQLDMQRVYEDFCAIFNNSNNVHNEAYFDKMTCGA